MVVSGSGGPLKAVWVGVQIAKIIEIKWTLHLVCFSSSQTAALDDLCRLAGQEEEWESSNNSTYYHHPNNNHNHHHHHNNNNHHYDITNKQKNNIFPCEE